MGLQMRSLLVGLFSAPELPTTDWLRLDTDPKFVQFIKLVQAEVGKGTARVRPPRLELDGAERDDVLRLVRARLAARPQAVAGVGAGGRVAGDRTVARA